MRWPTDVDGLQELVMVQGGEMAGSEWKRVEEQEENVCQDS